MREQVWSDLLQSAKDVHRTINEQSPSEELQPWISKTLETAVSCARLMFETDDVRNSIIKEQITPLEFWRRHHLAQTISQLKPLAQTLLGLPATAASCERVWSSAGRLNDRRAALIEKKTPRDAHLLAREYQHSRGYFGVRHPADPVGSTIKRQSPQYYEWKSLWLFFSTTSVGTQVGANIPQVGTRILLIPDSTVLP